MIENVINSCKDCVYFSKCNSSKDLITCSDYIFNTELYNKIIDKEEIEKAKENIEYITNPENIKRVASIVRFEELTEKMLELYKLKNKKYGNSFSKTFQEYGATMLCIRLEDKLNRAKQLLLKGEIGTEDESVIDTLVDLANYAIMGIMEIEKTKK